MRQINTQAIILRRTDYGEADRILMLLTPDQGKLSLIAKGVRRSKSKLAGGIELFSVSDISFLPGRSNIGTLISTRLIRHYGNIVGDVTRTMLGYDLIKRLNQATEDEPEEDYFDLLEQAFAALENPTIDVQLIRVWFLMQLLRIAGHTPNLESDTAGVKLAADQAYTFSIDDMTFVQHPEGQFGVDEIKFLRVGFAGNRPEVMQKITGLQGLLEAVSPLIQTISQIYIRS
jgi:DNA repair protein RecO (recombination protein O)